MKQALSLWFVLLVDYQIITTRIEQSGHELE